MLELMEENKKIVHIDCDLASCIGAGKLSGVGKALGKSIKDFKNEVKEDKEDEAEGSANKSQEENKA